MKKYIAAFCLFLCGQFLFAQNQAIETEIRSLEQREVQAVLTKDTMALKNLWDKEYIVHNPEGKIVPARSNSVDRPVLQTQRTSFTREVQKININGDVVISMGKEIVVPMDETGKPGQTVERRYTNIWMKKDGSWRLISRHANRVCQ